MGTWDVLLGSIIAIAGACIFLEARTFPNLAGGYPGPGLFPQLLGVLFVLSGLGVAGNAVVKRAWAWKPPLSDHPSREKINALLVVLAVIFYILLADTLGFIPMAIIILIALMFRTGVSLRWSIVLGIGLTLAIYILFNRILHVPLPSGLLKYWL